MLKPAMKFSKTQNWVPKYDFYFKRSVPKIKNLALFGEQLSRRVFPLGFNYFVTCKGNPYGEVPGTWKSYVRMQHENRAYYDTYLAPDKLIERTLRVVEETAHIK